jgi:hypothetical protein
MTKKYGPWVSSIDAGSNPQLSAFWKRRLKMLTPASQTGHALTWRNLLWLVAAGSLLILLPTFQAFPAKAGEDGKESGDKERLIVEKLEGADVIIIRGKKKDVAAAEKAISGKKPAETGRQEKKAGPRELKYANGVTFWIGKFNFGGSHNIDEVKKLITEKKYKLLNTFDDDGDGKQYIYKFASSDGNSFSMNFSMPLDDVSSWEDYLQKQEEQQQERFDKINQAIISGKYRLLDVELMQIHVCRDVESGKQFKVNHYGAGTDRDEAFPTSDHGDFIPPVKPTSWKEHLQAIRDGKRELLESESLNHYIYEMTADDGTKLIFTYGGSRPLNKIPVEK